MPRRCFPEVIPEPFVGFDALHAALEVGVLGVDPDQRDRSISLTVLLRHAEKCLSTLLNISLFFNQHRFTSGKMLRSYSKASKGKSWMPL